MFVHEFNNYGKIVVHSIQDGVLIVDKRTS